MTELVRVSAAGWDHLPFPATGAASVYAVWLPAGAGYPMVRLGYAVRRRNASQPGRSGWEWVAFLPDGRPTDEAHATRADVVAELRRRYARGER